MRGLILLVLVGVLAWPAHATILWQQMPDVGGSAFIDHEFVNPGYLAYSTYQVHDVVVGSSGWWINSITGFYQPPDGSWPSEASVRLNIFDKVGSSPVSANDPTAGDVFDASLSVVGGYTEVTLDGLNIYLTEGDYWIGMTPIIDYTLFGQEWHSVTTSIVGDQSAFRNPSGAFGYGTGWNPLSTMSGYDADGALRIDGVVPEPATISLLLLGLGALVYARRRR